MIKKKLLLIVPNLALGGQQRVAINTAVILESEYDLTLAVFTMGEAVYHPNCPVVDIKIPAASGIVKKSINVLRRIRALRHLKKELNIDITFSFGKTANIANALSRVRDKIIVSVHGYGSLSHSRFGKTVDKQIYERADIVVCVAKMMAKDLADLYAIPVKKIRTLYNPYDSASIAEHACLPADITITHPAIMTMGRLHKVKGYRHLLRAFDLVRHKFPEAMLVFIGDGSARSELETFASDLGLLDQVVFVGFQSNPYSYLAMGDIYTLSSIHEGFPNGLIEAMACSLPVIATDCRSGPREILSDSSLDIVAAEVEFAEYGILTPPFSSDDSSEPELDKLYADAILQLINNEEVCQHYRQKSKERSAAFSFEAYRNNIIEIIEGNDERF